MLKFMACWIYVGKSLNYPDKQLHNYGFSDILSNREWIRMIVMPIVILAMPAGGDRDFMEDLYRKYHRLMYATAWKYVNESSTVEDVVSDSCVALMKKIPTLRKLDHNKTCVYIVSTVRNTSINALNKQSRLNQVFSSGDDEFVEALPDGEDIVQKIILEEELNAVMRAINSLPEKEQMIMKMKYSMELSDEVIADQVGLSVNSIRKYVSRARNHIKATLYKE